MKAWGLLCLVPVLISHRCFPHAFFEEDRQSSMCRWWWRWLVQSAVQKLLVPERVEGKAWLFPSSSMCSLKIYYSFLLHHYDSSKAAATSASFRLATVEARNQWVILIHICSQSYSYSTIIGQTWWKHFLPQPQGGPCWPNKLLLHWHSLQHSVVPWRMGQLSEIDSRYIKEGIWLY